MGVPHAPLVGAEAELGARAGYPQSRVFEEGAAAGDGITRDLVVGRLAGFNRLAGAADLHVATEARKLGILIVFGRVRVDVDRLAVPRHCRDGRGA